MPNIDPRILLLFCLLFVGLAVFNLYLGIKRLHQAHARGEKVRWYKQLSILTGIEYVLLALSFVGSLSISSGWLPGSIRPIVFPLYLAMLLFAAILAAVVVYQNSKNARSARTASSTTPRTPTPSSQVAQQQHIPEEQEQALQRRRERRQKAAAARRRRAGRA
jgi:hypothetical protein